MQFITVLLRGIYRRYAIHKLCSTLFEVYEVIVTNNCNVKEDDNKNKLTSQKAGHIFIKKFVLDL